MTHAPRYRSLSFAALACLLAAGAARAELVDGPWTNAVGQGNGPILGANTAAPTVGDGTPNSAEAEMISSPFTPITLATAGDQIVFTGAVTLFGTIEGSASSGNPRTQFRFGLFDGDGDDLGWPGYLMTNAHGSGSPNGSISRKNVGNSSAYLSTSSGAASLTTTAGNGTLFHDGAYEMSLTIERNAADHLLVSGTLLGANGFSQVLSVTDTSAATLGTFTFDRLGFLLGGNLDADQADFADLTVTYIPAVETLTLEVAAGGAGAGPARLVNRSAAPIALAYYEIHSALGSLDPDGWQSLDDQDPVPPPAGWGEAAGTSEELLSEARILGATTVAPGAALSLGDAFNGPALDLQLLVGDGAAPLAAGEVVYVVPGDFNRDGAVTAADLADWKNDFPGPGADADFDGDSDGRDFLLWQRNLAVPAAAAVPEPTALALLLAALVTPRRRTWR